ncbi:MAG TPA: WXG100 family type VII secretion target [Candidatus Avipropionibacterium avicola]|uniref:ESAT-6-like protein n=1 Tax=Candidatus Avipropionibacterium avicola TaxID=2840701 RepID=A0A9D1GX53_9ACTN|nr:WXG100 family type VII secretion target [Candidatus Avipropionibacterium avicola]
MSDYTTVNAGAMQQGIGDLQTAYTGTSTTLDNLEQQLNVSLGQWDGDAREAYAIAKSKWDQAANHMAQVIQKMTSTLGQISENYDGTERANQQNWA